MMRQLPQQFKHFSFVDKHTHLWIDPESEPQNIILAKYVLQMAGYEYIISK
jgi:hypothetical protein